MGKKTLVMTVGEYERLRNGGRRKFNGRWYRIINYASLGVFFHRCPKVVVNLTLMAYEEPDVS